MSKKAKVICFSCLAALILLLLCGFLFAALPWLLAGSELPEDALLTLEAGGGSLSASWPRAARADSYLVEAYAPGAEEPLLSLESGGNSCTLSPLPAEGAVRITVTPLKHFDILAREFARAGAQPIDVTVTLAGMEPGEIGYELDEEEKTLALSFDALEDEGLSYELRLLAAEGERTVARFSHGEALVRFGEGADELAMPAYDAPDRFVVRSVRTGAGYVLTGAASEAVTVEREDLLGRVLELRREDIALNVLRLTWNETKGHGYELQQLVDGEWTAVLSVERDGEREYTTPTLKSCTSYAFRVVTVGGDVPEGAEYAAEPAVLELFSEPSPLYCTVWPMKELALYADTDMGEQLGTVPAAAALCVVGEENGLFRVRSGDTLGYIDSDFCLIDLPGYMGELCTYDITNSYASKYMMHGFEIPGVTGEVVEGYERVRLADGASLAPYLYPCCEKLIEAAAAARADGYRLKIYDSYRPNMATRAIYDTAELLLDEPLPETAYESEERPGDLPETAEGEELTYRRLVTEGSYTLANFLARSGSAHNMGIALDLTLEVPGQGDLEMQTEMHDLSWYSVIARNNANAQLLAGYMKGAGFGGLTSEWWHFQYNETRDALGLDIYLYPGVSPEGWAADDNGWRYRRADGSFITNATAEIGGSQYTFDGSGYAEIWGGDGHPTVPAPGETETAA